MAECTISRCSQERRIFRKELQKWSKEILYVLGLERLAEELMGARKWKILIQPFTDLEVKNPIDWYPEETCYFCSAKKQPPYDPASGIIPTVDGYSTFRIDTDEQSTSSDQGALSGSFTTCASTLSPWQIAAISSRAVPSSPPLFDQPLDLSVASMRQCSDDAMICTSRKSLHSAHSTKSRDDTEASSNSVLKVPQIPLKLGHRRRLDTNSKRSYTEDELQAALRDIQSGKLGTRRAAVIYGIPRSTLRNKVYKLANESKSRAHCRVTHSGNISKSKDHGKNLKLNAELEVPVNENANSSTLSSNPSASESLRQLLKHTITQKVQSGMKCSETKLSVQKNLHQDCDADAINTLQMLGTLECSQALAPVLSHVFSDIQHLALVKSESFHSVNQSLSALQDDLKLPLLPDLIRRLAEERMEIERDSFKESVAIDEDVPPGIISGAPSSNVILKVPSFKPAKSPPTDSELDDPILPVLPSSSPPPGTSSHMLSGNKGIAVSLKELIARSISQKVSCHFQNKSIDDDSNMAHSFIPADSPSSNVPWVDESTSKNMKESSLSNANNSSNSSDSSKSEKRTRPKRGRYRNYDRDNLARAVRAVQKGEMSVHRAGTFYGVPHSTLEYKVKERHLLRPRKRDILNSSLVSDVTESVTLKTNHNFAEENISVKNLKSTLNQIPDAVNGLTTDTEETHRPSMGSYPSPLSLWQSMPFFSFDFSQLGSNNFFASQMMRKLQENALLHEETHKKRKGQDFGILESLIKSSLERSVSPESKTSLILSTDTITPLSEGKEPEDTSDK